LADGDVGSVRSQAAVNSAAAPATAISRARFMCSSTFRVSRLRRIKSTQSDRAHHELQAEPHRW